MNRIWIAAALFAVIGGFATAAQANPIAIYSTGDGQTPGGADAHWTIQAPGSSTPTQAIVNSSTAAPPWIANNSTSQWIGPKADGSTDAGGTSPGGSYTYQTTFDLTGLNPATASLSGGFAADNCVAQVLINGHALAAYNNACGSNNMFAAFTTFAINSGFINGVNTLTFVVVNYAGNSGNPTGLNVYVSGTASKPVPEPTLLGLFGLGLLGLGGLWLRRRGAV